MKNGWKFSKPPLVSSSTHSENHVSRNVDSNLSGQHRGNSDQSREDQLRYKGTDVIGFDKINGQRCGKVQVEESHTMGNPIL